jgi:hypothetical protein
LRDENALLSIARLSPTLPNADDGYQSHGQSLLQNYVAREASLPDELNNSLFLKRLQRINGDRRYNRDETQIDFRFEKPVTPFFDMMPIALTIRHGDFCYSLNMKNLVFRVGNCDDAVGIGRIMQKREVELIVSLIQDALKQHKAKTSFARLDDLILGFPIEVCDLDYAQRKTLEQLLQSLPELYTLSLAPVFSYDALDKANGGVPEEMTIRDGDLEVHVLRSPKGRVEVDLYRFATEEDDLARAKVCLKKSVRLSNDEFNRLIWFAMSKDIMRSNEEFLENFENALKKYVKKAPKKKAAKKSR